MDYRQKTFDETVMVAPGAVVVGDVTLGKHVNIWYNAVLRGDDGAITVGERGEELADLDAQYVFSADMMSDVLAFCGKCSVLITGLCNPQVVRTAEMLDICCIIFVRGKMPDENMLALARGKSIAVLATEHYMFTTCGILYENGLRGGA